jgi:hypothetical protein
MPPRLTHRRRGAPACGLGGLVLGEDPAQAGFAGVLVAAAVLELVLYDERGRREVGAEPDVAAALGETELGAGLGAHAEAHVLHAAIAHDVVRHVVLDDRERRPAGHRLAADHGAGAEERKENGEEKFFGRAHRTECCDGPIASVRGRRRAVRSVTGARRSDGIIARP